MNNLTVFILSAGYGTRLHPLTDRIAKPLIPFFGKSSLERTVEKVRALKPDKILCNAHHLAEQLIKAAQKLKIECIYEAEILGTGGSLNYIKSILGETEYFLVCNGDIIHDIDLQAWVTGCIHGQVASAHTSAPLSASLSAGLRDQSDNYMGHLLTIQRPDLVNTILSDSKGQFLGIKGYSPDENRALSSQPINSTFSGIALYHKSFLDYCTSSPADIKPFWQRALDDGKKFKVHITKEPWFDFGKPQDLWDTYVYLMQKENTYTYNYMSTNNPKSYVSNECGIQTQAELSRVIWLEQNQDLGIFPEKKIENKIIGKDFIWEINQRN